MTVTELDQVPVAQSRPPRSPWPGAIAGFVVGVLAVVTLLVSRPTAEVPLPATGVIRFAPDGGRVDYAAVWDASKGPGQVAYRPPVDVTAPWTAVLTVRAEPGKRATCRIYVNDELADEQIAADGSSATCIALRH